MNILSAFTNGIKLNKNLFIYSLKHTDSIFEVTFVWNSALKAVLGWMGAKILGGNFKCIENRFFCTPESNY